MSPLVLDPPNTPAPLKRRRQAPDAFPKSVERGIRRAYFACLAGGEHEAHDLGVGPDRVIEHLRAALRPTSLRPSHARLLHLHDVALAAACVDADPTAWRLLCEGAERPLIRAGVSFQTTTHAAVRARGLLAAVRESTLSNLDAPTNLRRYVGDAPLRGWLVERLMASIARELAERNNDRRCSMGKSAARIESTLRLLRSELLKARDDDDAAPVTEIAGG
jgi:hypothetical protein